MSGRKPRGLKSDAAKFAAEALEVLATLMRESGSDQVKVAAAMFPTANHIARPRNSATSSVDRNVSSGSSRLVALKAMPARNAATKPLPSSQTATLKVSTGIAIVPMRTARAFVQWCRTARVMQ